MARSRQLASSPHMEWTSLLEVSGPFLSPSVLDDTDGFQQGLPAEDDEGRLRRDMRNYYEQWLATAQTRRPDADLHRAWLKVVVEDMLEWPADRIAEGQAIPPGLSAEMPEHKETLQPDLVLTDDDGKPLLLMHRYPASQMLDKPVPNRRWNESPASRMAELLQRTGNRLGLVTNGEQWMLVNAKSGEPTGFATWHAGLWFEEPSTFTAFRALLGVERFFGVADDATLVAMLDRSAESQANVTTQLGDQVRQAIELLVAAIDEADQDRHGELLAEVDDETVYEAAITVMMRLVFLLFAEDQRPPLFGDNAGLYDQHYSVSGLIEKLEEREKTSGEEVLEHQRDAWSRLLATFRLVYAGSDHPDMRQPAYGGSLFDPDRFPFLEGRVQGTSWETEPAVPLPLNNRTVLHMLQAIQFLELPLGRHGQTRQRLSFRALDVEQIGHVYEQLLEHTAVRADGPALGLIGRRKKGAGEPEVSLADLEAWRAKGEVELLKQLKDVTNRSVSALRKALDVELDALQEQRLLVACDSDRGLYDRVRPFAGIIRHDRADRPLVFRAGGLYVTAGSDRATTGAHYTPRSLTESIVQHALEPLVYDGPAEGKPREDWQLISPKALLELKVCDPAMGSGAFLVQACRFLSERLVEAWDQAEERMTDDNPVDSVGTGLVSVRSSGRRQPRPITIAPDGSLSRGRPSEQILPQDPAERLAIARRLVVDHCLYGVDVNPLAVDMAKLSLWLVTLQKDRPFTFIDHRLRCGDSLLGIGDIEQLRHWNLQGKPDGETWRQTSWFHQQMKQAIERAVELRRQIEAMPELDVHDSERKADLLEQAEQTMGLVKLGADLLIGSVLHPEKKRRDEVRKDLQYRFSLQVDAVKQMVEGQLNDEGRRRVSAGLAELRKESQRMLSDKRPFHWTIEFPEVFLDAGTHSAPDGFSAIVGNPPFLGGQKLTSAFGGSYRDYLVEILANGKRGSADVCAYFFLRNGHLLRSQGRLGLLATSTIAEGDTREIGLDTLARACYAL